MPNNPPFSRSLLFYQSSMRAFKAGALDYLTSLWADVFARPEYHADAIEVLAGREGDFEMPKRRHFGTAIEAPPLYHWAADCTAACPFYTVPETTT